MRRSSWVMVGVALLMLILASIPFVRAKDAAAPPFTAEVMTDILERGRRALEKRDTAALLAMLHPDARLLNRSPDQIRIHLNRMMRELGESHLRIRWSNLSIRPRDSSASFDLHISERTPRMEAHYYPNLNLRVRLQKHRTSYLFGLFSVEEWRVIHVESDMYLDVPEP